MHGNQVPLIELSFIDNFSRKKLSLNLTKEVGGLQQEEYMFEKCRDNKYFLINLDQNLALSCPKKGGDRSLSHPL